MTLIASNSPVIDRDSSKGFGLNWKQHKLIRKSHQFLDIIILLVLVLLHVTSPESTLKTILGLLFFFLPGYSVTRFVLRNGKSDYITKVTYTVMVSLCVLPLIGNLVQIVTFLSSYALLLAILVFSLPLLLACDTNPMGKRAENGEVENEENVFYKGMAFFGSIAVGLGLYLQASLGTVAPRGWDIYDHMYVANNIISTGKLVFHPSLNVLSNFHHFLLAELSLLTGLDMLNTALLGQTMLGALFMISIFYFARCITGSLTASFTSTVLFIAGPPILNVDMTRYFYYFHPMWVAFSIFPFVLAYVHETLVNRRDRSGSIAPLFIVALFLYHLTVGLIFVGIILLDFLLLLLKFRRKSLVFSFGKMAIMSLCLSSAILIPFLFNITNPFKHVYPQGGLQTIYTMFFGISGYQFVAPSMGWDFLAEVFSNFLKGILPLIIIGVPGLAYLFLKKSNSFILIFSCVFTGLVGLGQPLFGLAFMPERFSEPLILFGSTLAGASLSLAIVIPNMLFRKYGRSIKIRVGISKPGPSGFILLFLTFSFTFLYGYIVFYSPANEAVLDTGALHIYEDDLIAIRWIDENIPRNSRILMDQYLQIFFTGITGRKPLFSISSEKPFWMIWDVYPLSVYKGQTDPLKVDVGYIVVSPWSTGSTEYFNQHANLTRVFEHSFIRYETNVSYAVYEVIK